MLPKQFKTAQYLCHEAAFPHLLYRRISQAYAISNQTFIEQAPQNTMTLYIEIQTGRLFSRPVQNWSNDNYYNTTIFAFFKSLSIDEPPAIMVNEPDSTP